MKNHKFIVPLFLLILVFIQNIYTQNVTRIELNARMNEDTYKLIPCGKMGVVVFYCGTLLEDNNDYRKWHFALFNDKLEEVWINESDLIDKMEYFNYDLLADDLYLYFYDSGKNKPDQPEFQILKISLQGCKFSLVEGHLQERSVPTDFKVVDNKAIVGLKYKKYEVELCFIDLKDGTTHLAPIEIQSQNLISGIFPDTSGHLVYVVINNFIAKEQNAVYYATFTMDGIMTNMVEIKPVLDNKYLNTAEVVFYNNSLYILGNYSVYKNKIPEEGINAFAESAGFYISKFQNSKQEFINFYNFLEFENLYSSMNGRDIMKIRQKAEKQKKKRSEYSLNYDLLVHPVIMKNDQFILLAEAFYPEYRTVTDMYYDYYGRLMPQTYTVFDGYKYFNGIVASFDPEGNLVWENDIEIWNILTFDLDKYVHAYFADDDLVLFYYREGKINYKVIDQNDIEDADQINIETKYSKDKVIEEAGSNMICWYDHYFICYGYQEIRNNSIPNSKRTVFYVNKVAFQ
ncbi:MAG: hypothetical protein IMY70_05275 [Bacteroidetes bacterium]|nr:hypothetical protein [Bacteroidota bacterium]